jgi:mono/diheme cytochrome c family protein
VALAACEQNSAEWFPHMKKQIAVQAFEEVSSLDGRELGPAIGPGALLPPEGAVPIDGGEPLVGRLDVAAADALVNPADPQDFRSLENGERQYGIYCELCHGATGMGDGPVSATGEQLGPFGGVFPLVGLTTSRSDGYLYTAIRLGGRGTPGFRMPAYDRIPSRDRWDIVNYVRYLDRKGGKP